jgi:hypothetical protein
MRKTLLAIALLATASVLVAAQASAAEVDFSGNGQFWYRYNDYGMCDKTTGTCQQMSDSAFMLKRARLKMDADLTNVVSFFSQVDFTGGPELGAMTTPLQMDFWTTLKFHKFFQFTAGQFIIPIGYEGPRAPYDFELVTYSLIWGPGQTYAGQQLGFFPYLRDLGAYFHGDIHGFNYRLGVVNGQGIYQSESILKGGNKWKDIFGRVGYHKKLGEKGSIGAGISYYGGWEGNSDDYDLIYKKMRLGADVKFEFKGLLAVAEYMYGVTEETDPGKTTATSIAIRPRESWGTYVMLGYTIPGKVKLQPLVRFDYLDTDDRGVPRPDLNDGDTAPQRQGIMGITGGVNYYFSKHAKLTLVYERLLPQDGLSKQYTNVDNEPQDIVEDQLILQLGVSF